MNHVGTDKEKINREKKKGPIGGNFSNTEAQGLA